jgi:hypothetical protein
VSNLAECTLSSEGPRCPGHTYQVNGSGEDFPPGDEFEGSGQSAEDKPERENPDVKYSAVGPRALQISLSPPIMNVRATTLQNSAARHIES